MAQQRTYLGDAIFSSNQDKDSLSLAAFYTQVEIGRLFTKHEKHALIFQQIDSLNYINELKLISFDTSGYHEKVIETFEIGMFIYFKRVDMNHDGYLDLIITQGSNYAWSRLYVFDPKYQTLSKVPGFRNYRAAERLGASDYFYSYGSMGCAGNEWGSKLFQVEGTQIVDYGNIHGRGCSQEEEKRVIEIRYNGTLKTLPFDKKLPNHGDKWPFIKTYWEGLILDK